MTDYTIAIYCFLDDYLNTVQKKAVSKTTTNTQLITTVLVAAKYFSGNWVKARCSLRENHGFVYADKSNFNRAIHKLSQTISLLFLTLGQLLQELNTDNIYLIDSFPVAVCKNIRIKHRSKLLGDYNPAYHGYNSSKKEYFYGFKIQVITTGDGMPIQYFIVAGSYHDNTAFQSMNIDLPKEAELYGDSAYTYYELEDLYKECDSINLMIERKSNSLRKDSPAMVFWKKQIRKRIETTFSEITADFPKKILILPYSV